MRNSFFAESLRRFFGWGRRNGRIGGEFVLLIQLALLFFVLLFLFGQLALALLV